MKKDSKILVAGYKGLVGSAITGNLKSKGYENLVFADRNILDMRKEDQVSDFFKKERPDIVFLAAAKVGGIIANNTYRAEFIYDNLQIQNNIIHQSFIHKVQKLIFLGSSCIYPKNSSQPMKEEYLLTSELEYTNEPYAIAKIAGIKMIESYNLQYGTNFLAVMPTNLYGYNDNFDLEKSHVLPALIRKMHLAKAILNDDFDLIKKDLNKRSIENISGQSSKKEIYSIIEKYGIDQTGVSLWGSGKPRREFLHSDDMADACVYIAEHVNFIDILEKEFKIEEISFPYAKSEIRNTHINIGTGKDMTIKELALMIKDEIVKYRGEIKWDSNKPDGTFQKLLDVSKLHNLGWKEKIQLKEGIKKVYEDYLNY